MKTTKLPLLAFFALCLLVLSCATIPKGATPVSNFETEKYLGQWYEIARMNFRFERNLNNTTANYSLRDDGKLKVVNRGFNYVKREWDEAEGKAKFRGDKTVGALKVSFFGPFYGAYNVIDIDPDYQTALVVGKNTKYIWILSRTPQIDPDVKSKYVAQAKALGYDIDKLTWPEHNKAE